MRLDGYEKKSPNNESWGPKRTTFTDKTCVVYIYIHGIKLSEKTFLWVPIKFKNWTRSEKLHFCFSEFIMGKTWQKIRPEM